ncbi:hypothetical protein [Nocardia bhagyanarayanae]|uniref:Uncharacterized protein n=1 Tax=Nocardia bhagyanarayanae TaxID=1215925 RepID=A0A543FIF3_9NOCA|nr:hypothetical protein [Nocardia bhagyanarayanae]TQM33640.1 hypothetical protein FB390_5377 [Nocardia bhagyanarayanae]
MNTDYRVKHLEMLQTIIARLSQQSFTVRGWSVTLVSVIFALFTAQSQDRSELILLALAPAWIFWGLDGYYLSLERRYRRLFASVAQQLQTASPSGPHPFDMISDSGQPFRDLARAAVAPSVAAIPAVLTALIIGYWAFVVTT